MAIDDIVSTMSSEDLALNDSRRLSKILLKSL